MTFKVDPDTHIDSLEKAEDNVLEGTSHWSCKIATTGQTTRVHRETNKAWRIEVWMQVAGWWPLLLLHLFIFYFFILSGCSILL